MLLGDFQRGVTGFIASPVYTAEFGDDADKTVVNRARLFLGDLMLIQIVCDI